MNLSQLTRTQKIIAVGLGFLLLVAAIVGIYFGFIKKDTHKTTPKSTPKPTPKSKDPQSPVTQSPVTPTQVTLSPAEAKAKDLEFVIIKGKTGVGPLEYTAQNSGSTRDKDTLTNDGGCWSFNSQYGTMLGDAETYITEVTLPSDIKATAVGYPKILTGVDNGLCNFTWKADIKPGQTIKFEGRTDVTGLKFTKV